MKTGSATDEPKATNQADRVSGEALLRARLRRLVREQPWLAVAAAGVTGGVLGGFVFSRAARLVFIAAAGYVADGLWQSEGRLDIDDLAGRLANDPAKCRVPG